MFWREKNQSCESGNFRPPPPILFHLCGGNQSDGLSKIRFLYHFLPLIPPSSFLLLFSLLQDGEKQRIRKRVCCKIIQLAKNLGLWQNAAKKKPFYCNPVAVIFFRFISGTAGVKQVGKEEISAAFPEVLYQPGCSQMAGTEQYTDNSKPGSNNNKITKNIQDVHTWGEWMCSVWEWFLKCILEVSVIFSFSFHTSPFTVFLLNQSAVN